MQYFSTTSWCEYGFDIDIKAPIPFNTIAEAEAFGNADDLSLCMIKTSKGHDLTLFKAGQGWNIPRSDVVVRFDNKYAQRVAIAPSSAEAIDTIVEALDNPDSEFFAKDEDFTEIDWSFAQIGEAIGRSYFTFCGLSYGVVEENGDVVDVSKSSAIAP